MAGCAEFVRRHAKLFFALALVAVEGIGLAGCQRSQSASQPGTLNFLIESMPTNLDPRIGTDAFSEHIDGLIFSSLVAHDANMNIVPDLAEKWETPDPLTYVFHLRHGVKFHDGRPLTSADVKFTFDSILSGAVKTPKRGSFRMVDSVAAPDDYTVVFHLKEPYASFLWGLARPGIGIVPRGAGADFAQHPIGSGPFRLVSMRVDEQIILARDPDYFGDSHSNFSSHDGTATRSTPVERLRLRIVPDAIVRALELRKGTADAEIDSLTPDMVTTLARDPGLEVTEQPGTVLAYIAMNFDDPILAHREVRQALAYATDREQLIQYLLRGEARLASNLLPPNHWAYNPNVIQYNYNPARANQLLDAAGFPRKSGGIRFHLTLKTSTEESTRVLSEALADEWEKVGIALDLRPLEFATFYSDITHGSFQLYTARWVGGNNDPDIYDFVFNSKKMPPNGANRGHYRNPELDSLIDKEREEFDHEKRKEILFEIQKIVAEDEPYINLWYVDNECVHRKRVTNVILLPSGDYEFLANVGLQ